MESKNSQENSYGRTTCHLLCRWKKQRGPPDIICSCALIKSASALSRAKTKSMSKAASSFETISARASAAAALSAILALADVSILELRWRWKVASIARKVRVMIIMKFMLFVDGKQSGCSCITKVNNKFA
jgi:hypothetical protein